MASEHHNAMPCHARPDDHQSRTFSPIFRRHRRDQPASRLLFFFSNQFSLHRWPQVMHYKKSASSLVERERNGEKWGKMHGTRTYLEEARHGLISTANLDLEECRLPAVTSLCGALDFALLGVVPCSRATKDILSLLALEIAAREQRLVNSVLVWTRAAFEAVETIFHGRDGQDIGAVGADWANGRRALEYRMRRRPRTKAWNEIRRLTEQHLCFRTLGTRGQWNDSFCLVYPATSLR